MKDRLRQMREKLGYSQNELEDFLELKSDPSKKSSAITKYERGLIKPGADVLAKLAVKCKVNLNWLLTGQGDMFLKDAEKIPTSQEHGSAEVFTRKDGAEILKNLTKVGEKIDSLQASLQQRREEIHEPSPRYGYNVIPFPSKRPWRLGVLSHASGMGEVCIVDDEVYIEGHISVELPERADFAVPARGTSMEPLIPNGSLLYVRRILPNELRDGDLALCWLREQYAGMVRRVFFQEGHEHTDVCLQSDNPRENKWYPYDPEVIACGCKVVGWEADQAKVAELLRGME